MSVRATTRCRCSRRTWRGSGAPSGHLLRGRAGTVAPRAAWPRRRDAADRSAPRSRREARVSSAMLLVIDVGNTNLRVGPRPDGVLRQGRRRGRRPAPRRRPTSWSSSSTASWGSTALAPRRRRRHRPRLHRPGVAATVEAVAARRTIACVDGVGRHGPLPRPRGAAGRRRAGPPGERLRGGAPLRHAGHRRRLRHRHHARRRRPRGRVRRRRHRARA